MATKKAAAKKKAPAKKKAAAKKAPARKKVAAKKKAAAPAKKAPPAIKTKMTKSQIVASLADSTGLTKKQVSSVMNVPGLNRCSSRSEPPW